MLATSASPSLEETVTFPHVKVFCKEHTRRTRVWATIAGQNSQETNSLLVKEKFGREHALGQKKSPSVDIALHNYLEECFSEKGLPWYLRESLC